MSSEVEGVVDSSNLFEELKEERNLLSRFMSHLSKTVTHDEVVKSVCFITFCSAYSEDPLNLFLRGPSSTGKTFNVVEASKYFNAEDIWLLGGLSPKALIHDRGKLVDDERKEINFLVDKPKKSNFKSEKGEVDEKAWLEARKQWDQRLMNSHYEIDLHSTVLVFLDAPHIETFNMLRPLLSHDTDETSYKFTDKLGSGRLCTTHVVLKGWPASIFCTTDVSYVEDLATRGFSVTPEMTPEKYKAANRLKAKKDMNPFSKSTLFTGDYDKELKKFKDYIRYAISAPAKMSASKAAKMVLIPYAEKLADLYPAKYSRDMRDYGHFLSLIKVNAMLNRYNRPIMVLKDGKTERYEDFVMATMDDLAVVSEIFRSMEETTRTGVPGHILKFFHEVAKPKCEEGPTHYDDLTKAYNDKFEETVSSKTVSKWCGILADIGWMDRVEDPDDKRRVLITTIKKGNTEKFTLSAITPLFTFEMFKEWFSEQQNYGNKNALVIYIKNREKEAAHLFDLNKIDATQETELGIYFNSKDIAPTDKQNQKNEPITERSQNSELFGSSPKDPEKTEAEHGLTAPTSKTMCEFCMQAPATRWRGVEGTGIWLCNECYDKLEYRSEE